MAKQYSPHQQQAKEFEDYVFDILSCQCQQKRSTVRIEQTERSGDGGHDVFIEAHSSINLLGIDFSPRQNKSVKIFVEIKATTKDRLSGERVSANIVRTFGKEFDCFILVTNKSVPPESLYQIQKVLSEQDISFHMVDGERLAAQAAATPYPWPEHWPAAAPKGKRLGDAVIVDDTVIRRPISSRLELDVYVAIYNRTDKHQYCRIFLQSDRDWRTKTADRGIPLNPYEVTVISLNAVSDVLDRKNQLRVGVESGNQFCPIKRMPGDLTADYATRFTGAGHRAAANRVREALDRITVGSGGELKLLCVSGSAGVGKTRILNEARRALAGEADNRLGRPKNASNFRFIDFEVPNASRASSKAGKTGHPQDADRLGMARLAAAVKDQLDIDVPQRLLTRGLAPVIAYLVRPSVYRKARIPVLILEDLHNADRALCRLLTALAQSPQSRQHPFVLIVSGRDDDTHDNIDFLSFVNGMKALADNRTRVAVALEPMSAAEARSLIRSIVRHIPPTGVRRIHALSGNVPANIVQCVAYLLDEDLLVILGRGTVGIVDQYTFEERSSSLPPSMDKLLHGRFARLGTVDDALQDALLAAGFFGTVVPREVLAVGLSAPDTARLDGLIRTLVERRFLKPLSPTHLGWHHESLLLFVKRELLGSRRATQTARLLLARSDILGQLRLLDQGRVAALAGRHKQAIGCWQGLLTAVRPLRNFSTLDIDTEYFEYIDHAFDSVLRVGGEADLLPKLLKTKLYIGAYNLSLRHCGEAVRFSEKALPRMKLPPAAAEEFRLWMRLLYAHCLMDSGFVGRSQRTFLELQMGLHASETLRDDAHLQFELYNCLEMLYGYLNHFDLATGYAGVAASWAGRSGDASLPAKELSDRALLYQYKDYELFLALSRESHAVNRAQGTERHAWHATLSLLAAELPRHMVDPRWLADAEARVVAVLRACRKAAYFSVLPRIYLLLAAIAYLRGVRDIRDATATADEMDLARADRLVDLGIDASLRHAIGITSWQLYNLKGMLHRRQDNNHAAFAALSTAVEQIDKEGLLFLGAGDLVCPNPIVIANLLKLCDLYRTTSEAASLLRRVRTYDEQNWSVGGSFEFAMATARTSGALFVEERPEPLLVDAKTGLGLALWL